MFTVPSGNPLKDRKEINRITWASWTRYVIPAVNFAQLLNYFRRIFSLFLSVDVSVFLVMRSLVFGLVTLTKQTSTAPIYHPAVSRLPPVMTLVL